ncbi:hypothetical protein OAB74_00180 [Candidatus Pelagibacter sp.]|nr:hypothetical protein [Candidatus Pelagibacter sp.]
MAMLFSKKNYIIKNNFIPKKMLFNFKAELNLIINKIIQNNKLPISKKCSIDLKLMSLEEINHSYISEIYSKIKDSNFFKKLLKNKSMTNSLKKILKNKFENHTKAVRIDLANNLKWNLTWHQEASYIDDSEANRIFVYLWFPLLNSNNEYLGGLDIVNRFTEKTYDYKIISKKNAQLQREPITKIKKNDKDIKQIRLKLGDILIFDKYLFHRSVVNFSHKAKLSCVLSFKTLS